MHLIGLPGVRPGKKIKPVWANTPSGFIAGLKKGRAVTGAGDYGAINLYYDDKRQLRGHFSAWMSIVDGQEFKSKAAALRWLKEWVPLMHRQ